MFTDPKLKYFKGMLADADKVIWDIEFKKFTAMNEREIIRRQYDQAQDASQKIAAQLLADPKNEQALNDKKAVEDRVASLKKDMDAIDGTILGSQPTEQLPNGAEGLDNKLKMWVDRREYIKAFIKNYC
jgi:hypothetical protein